METKLARARELAAKGQLAEAKLAIVEAIELEPDGQHIDQVMALLRDINRALSERDRARASPVRGPLEPTPLDPYAYAQAPRRVRSRPGVRAEMLAYSTLLGLGSGLALVGPRNRDGELSASAILTGAMGTAVGLGVGYWILDKYAPSRGQVDAVVWSGLIGGLLGGFTTDLTTGIGDTSSNAVFRGTSLGALLGTSAGVLYTSVANPSVDDVTVVGSVTLFGTAESILVGLVLDPTKIEAYSVNGLIGTGAGLLVGTYAAWRWDSSARRIAWVDAGALAGAAAPWLVYPLVHDKDGSARVIGGISAVTMVAGGYLAWRRTRGMDARTGEGQQRAPGLVQRSATGRWHLGSTLVRPLGLLPVLDDGPPARGFMVDLASGAF